MKKIIVSIIVIGVLLASSLASINALEIKRDILVETDSITTDNGESFDGYTLFNPWLSRNTYLINNIDKKIVHKWKSDHRLSLGTYLLENKNLIRTSAVSSLFIWNGGAGGRVEIFDWNGSLMWDFTYVNDSYCLHNDIEVLPNGNILMTVWESKTKDEFIDAGGDPNKHALYEDGYILIDYLIEVEPTGSTGGDIVWEWHVWDHLIQDYDPTEDNYGVVADHPELLDINHEERYADITHINSIDYNERYDQLLISSRYAGEIWVIDHSTNTTEAAGHTGGNYDKGGDILYRWGNPKNYDAGDEHDQKLYHQHDARWVESGYPGEGHITIFNNGNDRPGGIYSSVVEIIPPVDENGNYYLEPNSAYGPEEIVWTYIAENPTDFYSSFMSGAQRLPNGNTFICNGYDGQLSEVNSDKKIVWEYINLYPIYIPFCSFPVFGHFNLIFKTQCYTKDYPGICELSTNIESKTMESEVAVTEISPSTQIQSSPSSITTNR